MLGEIDVTLKRERNADDYRESLFIVRDRIRQLAEMTEQLMILVRAQEGQVVDGTTVEVRMPGGRITTTHSPPCARHSGASRFHPRPVWRARYNARLQCAT